jgi:hypothetical protein
MPLVRYVPPKKRLNTSFCMIESISIASGCERFAGISLVGLLAKNEFGFAV